MPPDGYPAFQYLQSVRVRNDKTRYLSPSEPPKRVGECHRSPKIGPTKDPHKVFRAVTTALDPGYSGAGAGLAGADQPNAAYRVVGVDLSVLPF